ncbi:hypothetical protein [Lacticaseibacillus hegangensis]|uniref:Uncharacterized protein n=1 Tax=Lacticaseibacillus hegangensis TaxID=2486010 RepID=A0ABW4CXY6_9LACO|nr:hypothetical protein [Lacticaseibacillus hegangensis]
MIGLAIGTIGVLGGVGALAYISQGAADKFMTKHPRVAEYFDYFAEDEPEDDKKAPAAATAGTKNFVNNIYTVSVTRKVDKLNARTK